MEAIKSIQKALKYLLRQQQRQWSDLHGSRVEMAGKRNNRVQGEHSSIYQPLIDPILIAAVLPASDIIMQRDLIASGVTQMARFGVIGFFSEHQHSLNTLFAPHTLLAMNYVLDNNATCESIS